MRLTLVEPGKSQDTVRVLRAALAEAEAGRLVGIAFVLVWRGRTWDFGLAGEASRGRSWMGGLLAACSRTLTKGRADHAEA